MNRSPAVTTAGRQLARLAAPLAPQAQLSLCFGTPEPSHMGWVMFFPCVLGWLHREPQPCQPPAHHGHAGELDGGASWGHQRDVEEGRDGDRGARGFDDAAGRSRHLQHQPQRSIHSRALGRAGEQEAQSWAEQCSAPGAPLCLPPWPGAPLTCMKMVPKKVALSKTSRSLGTCREDKPLEGKRAAAVDPSRAAPWVATSSALWAEPSPPSCLASGPCPQSCVCIAG